MSDVIELPSEMYPAQDMHGEHLCYVTSADAQSLLKLGLASTYSTRNSKSRAQLGRTPRVVGIRLLAPATLLADGGIDTDEPIAGRSFAIQNFAGTRFVFKEKLASEKVNGHCYRYKKLHSIDSPEWSLRRILTPPALQSSTYKKFEDADEAERQADPGASRRQNVLDLFKIKIAPASGQTRRANSDEPARKYIPVRPQLAPKPAEVVVMPIRSSNEHIARSIKTPSLRTIQILKQAA